MLSVFLTGLVLAHGDIGNHKHDPKVEYKELPKVSKPVPSMRGQEPLQRVPLEKTNMFSQLDSLLSGKNSMNSLFNDDPLGFKELDGLMKNTAKTLHDPKLNQGFSVETPNDSSFIIEPLQQISPLQVSVTSYDTNSGFQSWDDMMNMGMKMFDDISVWFVEPTSELPDKDQQKPSSEQEMVYVMDLNGSPQAPQPFSFNNMLSSIPCSFSLPIVWGDSHPFNVNEWLNALPPIFEDFNRMPPQAKLSGGKAHLQSVADITEEDDLRTGFPVAGIVAIIMSIVLLIGLIAWFVLRRLRSRKDLEFERVAVGPECEWHRMDSRRNSDASMHQMASIIA